MRCEKCDGEIPGEHVINEAGEPLCYLPPKDWRAEAMRLRNQSTFIRQHLERELFACAAQHEANHRHEDAVLIEAMALKVVDWIDEALDPDHTP